MTVLGALASSPANGSAWSRVSQAGRRGSLRPKLARMPTLGRQSLFINALLADLAAALLYELFTSGVLEHHGYLVDLKSGVVPLKIDAAAWAFMGYGDALIPPDEPSNLQPARS